MTKDHYIGPHNFGIATSLHYQLGKSDFHLHRIMAAITTTIQLVFTVMLVFISIIAI